MAIKKKTRNLVFPKKVESKAQTKQLLIEAGLEVFSQYGFEAATTKLISQRSGVNESLINRYFISKAGLLEAVIIHYFSLIDRTVKKYPHGKTLQEEIRNYMEAGICDFNQNPKFLRIIFPKMLMDPDFQKTVISQFEIPNPRLYTCLQAYQKKKIIHSSHNLKEVNEMLIYMIMGYFHDLTFSNILSMPFSKFLDHSARMFARDLMEPKDSHL